LIIKHEFYFIEIIIFTQTFNSEYHKTLKNTILAERTKNGGVLGEEIFCPRADFSDFVSARPASWRGGQF
jgi:hypothetical protein